MLIFWFSITPLRERETPLRPVKQMFFSTETCSLLPVWAQTVAALSLMCHSCRVFACRCISCREQVWTQTEQIKAMGAGVFVNKMQIWQICLFRSRSNGVQTLFLVLVVISYSSSITIFDYYIFLKSFGSWVLFLSAVFIFVRAETNNYICK